MSRITGGIPTNNTPPHSDIYNNPTVDSRLSVIRKNNYTSSDLFFIATEVDANGRIEKTLHVSGKVLLIQSIQDSINRPSAATPFLAGGVYEIFLNDMQSPIQFDSRRPFVDSQGTSAILDQPQFSLPGLVISKIRIVSLRNGVDHALRVILWEEPFQPGLSTPLNTGSSVSSPPVGGVRGATNPAGGGGGFTQSATGTIDSNGSGNKIPNVTPVA
jgi:hypothetical protein